MHDVTALVQIADELKPWIPVFVPAISFGVKQGQALVKRFQEHYKDDADQTRQQAIANAADASNRIKEEIDKRIEREELTQEQAQQAFARPDIAKHVQDVLLAASETPDELKHQELAALIGARLVAPPDSRAAILLRMACDNLQYLNSRQLRVLGLTYAVLYRTPKRTLVEPVSAEEYEDAYIRFQEEVSKMLAPFDDIESLQPLDFAHFEELGLARLSSWTAWMGVHRSSDRSSSKIQNVLDSDFPDKYLPAGKPTGSAILERVQRLMDGNFERNEFGLKAARLTPAGFAVANCVYSIVHGIPFESPDE